MATAPSHILALYEPRRHGGEALRAATAAAMEHGARLTVVTVALVEPTDRKCCDLRSVYWNGVAREIATDELDAARAANGADVAADFRIVTGPTVPSAVAREARRCGADMVVVARERSVFPWLRRRQARQVQRRTGAAVVATG